MENIVKVIISKDQKIVKHNKLIEARLPRITLLENQLLYIVMAQIVRGDDEFRLCIIPANEIKKALGLHGDSIYEELRKIARKLMSRTIELEDKAAKSWGIYHLIDKAEYKDSCLYVKLHRDIAPFMLKIFRDFTLLQLGVVLSFKTTSSIPLYEWLKKWEKIGKIEISDEDLKERLGVHTIKSYENSKDFKRRVLNPAQEEINEISDLTFTYEIKKIGRKIVGWIFYIDPKNKKENNNQNKESHEDEQQKSDITDLQQNLIDELIKKQWFYNEEAEKFVLQHGEEKVKDGINYLVETYEKQGKEMKNPAGLLFKAVADSYKTQPTSKEVKAAKRKARIEADEKKTELEEAKILKEKEENKKIWEGFLELPEDEKAITIGQVLSSKGEMVRAKYKLRGIEDLIVRGNIINHLKENK